VDDLSDLLTKEISVYWQAAAKGAHDALGHELIALIFKRDMEYVLIGGKWVFVHGEAGDGPL
jgi:hypothetical protein